MNFLEAVKAVAKGAKIRRSDWDEGVFIIAYGTNLVWPEDRERYILSTLGILRDDWEVVE